MGEHYDPQTALAAIWDVVVRANRYVEAAAPWVQAKAARAGDEAAAQALDTTLYTLAEALRLVAEALRPFLPRTAARMAEQLGIELAASGWVDALSWGRLAPGTRTGKPQPIFPRLEAEARAGD